MTRKMLFASAAALAVIVMPLGAVRADTSDADIAAVIDEGLNHSELMVNASQLMDGIGGRLTNSESFRKAQDWAMAKFTGYGLKQVHREPFKFGLGWNLKSWSARMITPRYFDMISIPVAWSPPTGGPISGEVIVAPMSKEEDMAAWKGKLAGKIVLISMPGETSESTKGVFRRYDSKDIADLDDYAMPHYDPDPGTKRLERRQFPLQLSRFLKEEGALAIVKMSYRDGRLVSGEGYDYTPGETLALPEFEVAQEDYRRLVRLAQAGTPPTIELTANASYDDSDLNASNVIAEIPGSDPKAGYVMAGGHFDSWIAADGASDNGAGSVVVLEAARILSTLGVKPKRTIRFVLWGGEEQGLLGSRAYIEQHLATRPVDPKLTGIAAYYQWSRGYPITKKPGYDDMKAYFNLDNGSGKIRGIYAENNIGAVPLLKKWLAPFSAMDASSVVISKTGGTDHVFMQAVGLPGFQFIQDPLDYSSRVHHSDIDTVDHMRGDDLREAATIMAAMLLQAANSDQELPRPPLPREPTASDPFKVTDPDDR